MNIIIQFELAEKEFPASVTYLKGELLRSKSKEKYNELHKFTWTLSVDSISYLTDEFKENPTVHRYNHLLKFTDLPGHLTMKSNRYTHSSSCRIKGEMLELFRLEVTNELKDHIINILFDRFSDQHKLLVEVKSLTKNHNRAFELEDQVEHLSNVSKILIDQNMKLIDTLHSVTCDNS